MSEAAGYVQLDAATWVRPERVDAYRQSTGGKSCTVVVQGLKLTVKCSLADLQAKLHGPAEPDLGVGGVLEKDVEVEKAGWWLAPDGTDVWELRIPDAGGYTVMLTHKPVDGPYPNYKGHWYPLLDTAHRVSEALKSIESLDLSKLDLDQVETLGREVGLQPGSPPRRRDRRDGWWLAEGDASSAEARWQLRFYNQPGPGFQVVATVKGSKDVSFPAHEGEHYALKQEGVR